MTPKALTDLQITSIHLDSRQVKKGSTFIAIKGEKLDGHDYIKEAILAGASVIIHEKPLKEKVSGVRYIKVEDARVAVAELAQDFYNHPSEKLKLVGVTGTNGKTTTATLLFKLFRSLGYHSALLSTIENRIDDEIFPATLTTPDPITLTAFLDLAVKRGCKYAFMECSSHAIDQKRTLRLQFAGALFTNLTLDHLDYHKTFEDYARTKKELFDTLPENSFAIANQDDARGEYMLSNTKARKHFFSLKNLGIKQSMDGLTILFDGKTIKTKLIGNFNAYNILGIYLVAKLLSIESDEIISAIETLTPPSGRLEFIKSKKGVYGVVDYSHTPDALENVLKTLKEVAPKGGHIITVVGCGGDRDKSKRPVMGKIAFKLSDYTVFTSDNPRSENAQKILEDIVVDLPKESDKYECEVDRAKAMARASTIARSGDIILVAGKGHEDYQILGEKKIHFSDKEVLEKIFNQEI
jgi:UDP-N-acetylmuramoyl-L-alanyl-D-glutamate--2,6-diaminopimelate ligase